MKKFTVAEIKGLLDEVTVTEEMSFSRFVERLNEEVKKHSTENEIVADDLKSHPQNLDTEKLFKQYYSGDIHKQLEDSLTRKILDYSIVDELKSKVSNSIQSMSKQGYELYGSPTIIQRGNTLHVAQVMVKYVDERVIYTTKKKPESSEPLHMFGTGDYSHLCIGSKIHWNADYEYPDGWEYYSKGIETLNTVVLQKVR